MANSPEDTPTAGAEDNPKAKRDRSRGRRPRSEAPASRRRPFPSPAGEPAAGEPAAPAPAQAPEPPARTEGDAPQARGQSSPGDHGDPIGGQGAPAGQGRAGRPGPDRDTAAAVQQGGGRGEWQEREFWKRNKRKRGRHGGWQPRHGGGGGWRGRISPIRRSPPPPSGPAGRRPSRPARLADLAALGRPGGGNLLRRGQAAPARRTLRPGPGRPDRVRAGVAASSSRERPTAAAARADLRPGRGGEAARSVDRGYVDLNDRGALHRPRARQLPALPGGRLTCRRA